MQKNIIFLMFFGFSTLLLSTDARATTEDSVENKHARTVNQQALGAMMTTLRDCVAPELSDRIQNVRLHIEPNQDIFAYSSSGRIVISQGLLLNFRDKDFLHFILAHELSHHMLSHLERSQRMMPGEIFEETVAASLKQYFEFELEADLMATQMLRRCHINISRLGEDLEQLIASTRESAEIPSLLQFHQRRISKLKALPAN